jgi:hypothetical protein
MTTNNLSKNIATKHMTKNCECRECSVCNKEMIDGFVVDNEYYYCSKECLKIDEIDINNVDIYYTEWY